MPMTMQRVCWILTDMGIGATAGPLGIDLHGVRYAGVGDNAIRSRIENGSGIAGRGFSWHIVKRKYGFDPEVTESATTAKQLRRLLREWATDEQKPERPDYKYHAQMNHNKWGDSYVWVERKMTAQQR